MQDDTEVAETDSDTQPLDRKVAVITGASSGIGYATALQFADNDYDLVLAARRLPELDEVARLCAERGVRAITVVTDTSEVAAVQNLANQALETFGHIDVWINNAGTYLVGTFKDLPLKDMRRVMDVNFFGYVHGSQAALEHFRSRGRGTLINVSSVNAAAPQPYVSLYGASKAAIRSLDESIRMELRLEGLYDTIKVCTVMPAGVDTNLLQNSANYSGRAIQAVEPVYDPAYVAKRIYALTVKPKREKYVGPAGTLLAMQNAHLPGAYEKQAGNFTNKDLLGTDVIAETAGNLYESLPEHRGIRGGWQESRVSANNVNATLALAAVTILGVLGAAYLLAKKRGR